MNDSEFLRYCEVHSKSERALFCKRDVNRLLRLAGAKEYDGFTEWMAWHWDEMERTLRKAEKRLSEVAEWRKSMEKIEIPYKGLRFRLDEFTYDPGSMGNYYNPPEPPEFIIDKMSVADDWKVNGTYEWHDVPQPLLGFFSDDDSFVELCFAAFREEVKEEKLERLIAEEEDE